MKQLLIILSFALLCLTVQAQQFRMVSTGIISWSVLTDSTYSATITFNSDLTGGSFLPNQIVDTFQMFTDNQQLYTVDSVLSTTLSQATLRVKEYGTTNGTPAGQVMVYNPQGKTAVPTVNFGSTGASAKMQASVITYNASVSGEGTGTVDSTRLVQDSILVYYQDGVEVSRDTIPVSLGGGGGLDEAAVAAIVGDSLGSVDRSATNEIQNVSYTQSTRAVAVSGGGTGFTFPEATLTDPGLLSSFYRTRLQWQGAVNYQDVLIGGTMDPDSIISIAGVSTEGKNIYIGDRTYNTGAAALRKARTYSDNGIFIGRGVGIGGYFTGGNIFAGYQSGAFAATSGSIFMGYVAGRNASGVQLAGFGYKTGINSHGNYNLFGGYLAGRNNTGNYNILLTNGGGTGGSVIDTLAFDSLAVDLVNQRIYVPSHGITDSVFVGSYTTTGTSIVNIGSTESGRHKFEIVGADSIRFWNYDYLNHYYLNSPMITTIGTGTHSITVQRSRHGRVVISPRGDIGALEDEGVALGNSATRSLRIGEDAWVLPATRSGTNTASWRNKGMSYDWENRQFIFDADTSEFNKIIVRNDGNSPQAIFRPNTAAVSKPGYISLTAHDGAGSPVTSSVRGESDGSVRIVNSTASYIGTRADGLSFEAVGSSAGTGGITDLNVFEAVTSGGTDARYININRAGTGFAGYRMEQDGEISAMQFQNSSGTYDYINGSNNDGFFRWRTTTSSTATERMRLNNAGSLGIGQTTITAYLHLKAGTATVSTAPIKFTAGTNLTSPEAGAMEWDGTNLHITQTTGPTRKTLAYTDALTGYAPLASPTFTGVPAAPTATAGTSTTQIATTEFVADESALINASLQQYIDLTTPMYGEAHSTATRTYSSGGTQVVDTLTATSLQGFTYSVGILTNMTSDTVIAKLTFSATVEHVATALNFTAEISNGTNAYHDGCKISTTLITGEPQNVSVTCIAPLPTSVGTRMVITSVGTYELSNVSLTVEKLIRQ